MTSLFHTPIDQDIVDAAAYLVDSVLFEGADGKPRYYGNHRFAQNAANSVDTDRIKWSPRPEARAALDVVNIFNAHMADDNKNGSAAKMLAAAKQMQAKGGLDKTWAPKCLHTCALG